MGAADGFTGFDIRAICRDELGHCYFGHLDSSRRRRQISRFDGHQFHLVFGADEEDLYGAIKAIVKTAAGDLWFALGAVTGQRMGSERGVGRLRDGEAVFYGLQNGLVDERVEDLLEDGQGQLWIATLGGISRFDGAHFHNYTTEDGLPNNHVRCIFEDAAGDLWFGTDGGVVHAAGDIFQVVRSSRTAPTTRIVQEPDGSYWFATQDGLVRYCRSDSPPRVQVLRLIADQVWPHPTAVEVPASARQVVFEFKGMSFRTHPRDLGFEYRLEGVDSSWLSSRGERRAYYRDLPPGDYRFEVRAIDRDLHRSEAAQVRLRVVPDPRLQALAESLSQGSAPMDFIGDSPALRRVQAQLLQVAPTDLTVLITGETGTGKGLAARLLHAASGRVGHPFIQVNCGALPEGLVESELFGHERGAFTGAAQRKLGKVEVAAGGSLFLDEIGDLALDAQVKLLRLLEEGGYERVGGTRLLHAEARIVAATNRDLAAMVERGEFRRDLFFRLQVFPVQLPPLRQRLEDIGPLGEYFARHMAEHLGRTLEGLSAEALAVLRGYGWPGNVRELEHVVRRAVIVAEGTVVQAADIVLAESGGQAVRAAGELVDLQEHERRYIRAVLERTEWVIKGERGAAQILGLQPAALRYRMKKLGIVRESGPGARRPVRPA